MIDQIKPYPLPRGVDINPAKRGAVEDIKLSQEELAILSEVWEEQARHSRSDNPTAPVESEELSTRVTLEPAS